jgi:hypothetical protein
VPALPPVPQCLKIEFLWTQAGVPAANIFHCTYSGGPPSPSDCNTIAQYLGAAFWVEGLYEGYPSTTILVGVKCTDLTSDSASVGEFSIGQAGTYEGDEVPGQACVLVNYTISRRYRGGHPRTYFLPPTQSLLSTPSAWSDTIISELTSCVAALFNEMDSAIVGTTTLTGPVCVSYRTGDAPRVDPLVEPITGWTVSPIVATQRRRIRASSY